VKEKWAEGYYSKFLRGHLLVSFRSGVRRLGEQSGEFFKYPPPHAGVGSSLIKFRGGLTCRANGGGEEWEFG